MIYNFKTCCEFKNKYFSIDTNSMLLLNNVYAISLNSLNVCATLIEEIPLGNTTYFDNGSGGYILIEGSCFDCLNDYYSCYPSVTPTPLPNLPINRNDCDPITIFPMGVQCVTLNPSTNSSTDGGVSLVITGGTPPYTTDWYYQDITFTGPLMINLSGGKYSATTTDFYGDFVVNSVCTLIAPTL
jgi:hypothetical protein